MGNSAPWRVPMAAGTLAVLAGLGLGLIVLGLIRAGITWLWVTVPTHWGTAPAWYVIGLLTGTGALVYVIRRYVGDQGRPPIATIILRTLTPAQYGGIILAVLVSLWGGVVLGPEAALISTGSMVGTWCAHRCGITNAKERTTVIGLGATGAILALVVASTVNNGARLIGAPTSIDLTQLAWAIPIAITATIAVIIARVIGAFIARGVGGRPRFAILVGAGLAVAVCALLMRAITGEPVVYVATSGETLIRDLPLLTSASTIVAIIAFKTIAYAVSLDAGFRGGPFGPAWFIGASWGLLASLMLPTGPSAQAAIVVGVVAGTIATQRMRWSIAIILGIVIGFLMGTWTLVPAAVVGAVVARAIPRVADRLEPATP